MGELTLPQFIALKKGSIVFMCMESAASNIEPNKIDKVLNDIYSGVTEDEVMDEFKMMQMAKDKWVEENPDKKPTIKELYEMIERIKNEK